MKNQVDQKNLFITVALIFAFVVIALIDATTTFGTTVWVLNIVLIVLSVSTKKTWAPLAFAGLSTFGACIDLILKDNLTSVHQANLTSRGIGIVTFWTVAIIVLRVIQSRKELEVSRLAIEQASEKLAEEATIQSAIAEINDSMIGIQSVEDLCRILLERVSSFTSASIGSFYILSNDKKSLKRVAKYAYTDESSNANVFSFNEGIIGEAASQLKAVELNDVPSDYYLKIRSSLGEMTPKYLVAIPIFFEGKLNGVMELGTLKPFDGLTRRILDIVPENIGIAVDLALNRVIIQQHLNNTQKYNDNLQAQQEELKTLNEELAEKSKEIEEAYSKLESQQADLEESNSELEQKQQQLEEQTEALKESNNNLRKSKEEIQLGSQYKSEFLSNMSHELRTPLNSILILSELLSANKREVFTDDEIDSLKTITSSGQDLLSLINDILDLSKIESGKVELIPEPVNLRSFQNHLKSSFQVQVEHKDLSFEVECDLSELDETIITDKQRVEQIIKNFLSNALKFTESGSIRFKIFKSPLRETPIAISVEDTGVGIPKDKQEEIFEAFRQADGTTARQFGGTGLGLAISRELAVLLDGEIRLESEKNIGSKFTLLLPLRLEHSEALRESSEASFPTSKPIERKPLSKNSNLDISPKPLGKERSLAFQDDRDQIVPGDKVLQIIEDEENFAQAVAKVARENNFKCILSENGEAGLEDIARYMPSGVFLDLKLPGLGGMEVLEHIKRNPKTRHIPVHIASGVDQKKNALHMGAVGYLLKPALKDDLEQAFNRILDVDSRSIKRILLVEDDQIQLNNLFSLISDLDDVETIGVKTGKAAMNALKESTYDCVILDYKLPDMTGLELLQEMSLDDSVSHPPIIIHTAKDLNSEEERKLREYSSSIVVKSIHSKERLLDETLLFLHKVENQLPLPKQRVLRVMRERHQVLEGANILLVDDDMRNIFSLRKVLENKAATVTVARNGAEALSSLEVNLNIDIVLMDIMMPVMDGYEAMRKIREQDKFSDLPIIALTAKAMKGDREECINAGANDYLSKPVDPKRLLSLIRVWLSPKGF